MTSRRQDGETARRPATLRPLIGNQRRYVHAERFSESSYIVPMAYRFEAELDIGRFRAAIDGVFARHDALRTDFVLAEGAYHARVHEDVRYAFHQLALDADDFEAFRARALPIVFAPVALDDRRALFRVILAGIGPGRWRFCFALHHSLTDGASRNQFFREVVDLYEGRALEPARSFYLGGAAPSLEALAASEAHWRDWAAAGPLQLQDAPDLETTEADGPDTAMAVRELPLSGGAVRDAARAIGASKFGLMSAAYAIGLSARLDASDVLMGFQSAGRSGLGADMRAIGPYSNTLPLRVRVAPETPFAEIAARATAATREGLAHEALPFDALRSVARFDSDFVINAFPSEAPFDGAAIRGARREFLDRKTEFAFNLLWSEDDGRLTARIFYDPRRRAPDRTRAFLELTARLFEAGLATPERSAAELLAEVRMPPPRPAAAPAAAVEPGGADALTAPFLAHAAARPNAPAVVTRDGAVSYGALAAAARRVARDLAALGVGAGA
ncbi:MAG: condensation domain-containing protein, partial [Pseudomonadota bacterium]